MFYGLLGVALMLLWLFCIIDVILTPDGECRHLPKLLWLGIVVLLGAIGSAAWLLIGRPWPNGSPLDRLVGGGGLGGGGTGRDPASVAASPGPDHDRPARPATGPDDDDAFLRQVRERAEAQRRTEAARRREQEQAEAAERERRQGGGGDTGSETDDRS